MLSYSQRDKADADDTIETRPIHSAELGQLLNHALNVFSDDAISGILYTLSTNGIDLYDPAASYSLKQLEQRLTDIFGQDAAFWVISRIKNKVH